MTEMEPRRLGDSPEYADVIADLNGGDLEAERVQRGEHALRGRLHARRGLWPRLVALPVPLLVLLSLAGIALAFGSYVVLRRATTVDEVQVAPQPAPQRPKSTVEVESVPLVESQPPESTNSPGVRRKAKQPAMTERRANNGLAVQLQRFRAAEADAADGKHDDVLAALDSLEAAYPATPLSPEIAQLRLEVLVRAGRPEEAVAAGERLLSTADAGRLAQIYHVLGDSYVALDNCEDAVRAYRRALEHGLSPARERLARGGLARCNKSVGAPRKSTEPSRR